MLKKLKYILGVFMLIIFLVSVFYIMYVRIADEVPTLFGYSVMRVTTEDMEPKINIGEVVILKQVEPSELKLGDVISYKSDLTVTNSIYVTHQISKEPYEKDGVYYFTTRGLKADSVNDPEITDAQVRGKVMYLIPFVGTFYDFVTQWYGMVSLILLLVVLYGSDVVTLIRNFKKIGDTYDEDIKINAEDIKQSEIIEHLREREFEGIITNLEDIDL